MTAPFKTEADLCAAFIASVTKTGTWRAYPETAGFDILLVRPSDGMQIGVEAKLVLNAKVLSQALPYMSSWSAASPGPDYRAVLVPIGKTGSLSDICAALGVTVIQVRDETEDRYGFRHGRFTPDLPLAANYVQDRWHEWCPAQRCKVPDYIPDVAAGCSAPVALTEWKVRAIKLAILLEHRTVTRADFKALGLSPSRWTDPHTGWLVKSDLGGYRAGPKLPDFRSQHPRNFAEIEADRSIWEPKIAPAPAASPVQTGLFSSGAAA